MFFKSILNNIFSKLLKELCLHDEGKYGKYVKKREKTVPTSIV